MSVSVYIVTFVSRPIAKRGYPFLASFQIPCPSPLLSWHLEHWVDFLPSEPVPVFLSAVLAGGLQQPPLRCENYKRAGETLLLIYKEHSNKHGTEPQIDSFGGISTSETHRLGAPLLHLHGGKCFLQNLQLPSSADRNSGRLTDLVNQLNGQGSKFSTGKSWRSFLFVITES